MSLRVRQTVHMEALRVGQHALLVECADADEVTAAYALLRDRADLHGATEIVPAARTVLLDGLRDPDLVREQIAGLAVEARSVAPTGRLVELPTRYDGADLDEVARQWECMTAEVIRVHQATVFVVTFCGFAPGFAYCAGLPPELEVTRRPDPRPSVPAGSVALGGEFTAVYPTSSPGGWQLIGTTTATLWAPEAERPAVLVPGVQVRFVDG